MRCRRAGKSMSRRILQGRRAPRTFRSMQPTKFELVINARDRAGRSGLTVPPHAASPRADEVIE